MKAFITDYNKYCIFCGHQTHDTHHLEFGWANRKLADEDNLVIPVCRTCHDFIHNSEEGTLFSKMLGQALYELNYCAQKPEILEARQSFRSRYGKSYF